MFFASDTEKCFAQIISNVGIMTLAELYKKNNFIARKGIETRNLHIIRSKKQINTKNKT